MCIRRIGAGRRSSCSIRLNIAELQIEAAVSERSPPPFCSHVLLLEVPSAPTHS
jgi:hypothetical protein